MTKIEAPAFTWSPTDLVGFVACGRLSVLEREAERGVRARPAPGDQARLTFEKGRVHEAAYRARLAHEGRAVVDISAGPGSAARERAARETFAAMQAGAEVIAGATFVDGNFVGIADLLERVDGASHLGPWHYEVLDIKLASTARTSALLQLCAYAERLALLQGCEPRQVHLVLGDGRRESFAYGDFAAYYRAARDRFLASLDRRDDPYPEKIDHCKRCSWAQTCADQRREDDHLSEVANIRRSQRRKLEAAGITTMHALAAAPVALAVPRLAPETFAVLRSQAALQCATRDGGPLTYAFLEPGPGRGFALLPPADPADCYFDMEGDPFFGPGGLEYLFGVSVHAGTAGRDFVSFWGDSRAEEKRAFEQFVDFIVARVRVAPHMHVYHYANYEQAAMIRLAGRHATRGDEIDALLKAGVFVDLLQVVRQALQCSTDTYSIKAIERFYRPPRAAAVHDAIGSVIEYERYRDTGDPALRERILEYNRDDCESTLELAAWLRDRLAEYRAGGGTVVAAPPPPEPDADKLAKAIAAREEHAALVAALGDGVAEQRLATLLDYHRTEQRPEWRDWFARAEKSTADLLEDDQAIAGLVWTGEQPQPVRRSLTYRFTFPAQPVKLRASSTISYKAPGHAARYRIEAIDTESGTLVLSRAREHAADALPDAIFGGEPIGTESLRESIRRVARGLPQGRFGAVRALVERRAPALRDGAAFAAPDGITTAEIAELADRLDTSALVVQGPPGSGKTYTAAHVAALLLARGRRIGITARSHRAIHHLLEKIEATVAERGERCAGYVAVRDGEPYRSTHGFIACGKEKLDAIDGVALIAGTAWAFAREGLAESLDVLLIDEAGQLALADAIAVGACARSLILFGDPQQLPHVARATHVDGADVSALEHVLGDDRTIPPDRGVFLAATYRLEPQICGFVSQLMYDGRLHPAGAREHGTLTGPNAFWSGSGLRTIPVTHDDRSRESPEEAAAIADAVATLVQTELVRAGVRRPLSQRDIMVVAPYNLQAERLRAVLAARGFAEVEVGTVDLFQGREAEVALFSMTSSSGDDLPRGVEFAFSPNRLNVAISRARTLAVLVYSPRLVALQSEDVDDIRLVNAVALFAERATSL